MDCKDPWMICSIFNHNTLHNFPTLFYSTIDLTDYSFLSNSLVSMLMYFSIFSTDESYIPIFSYTELFLVDLDAITKLYSVVLRRKLE